MCSEWFSCLVCQWVWGLVDLVFVLWPTLAVWHFWSARLTALTGLLAR